jgi:hypothetical protein
VYSLPDVRDRLELPNANLEERLSRIALLVGFFGVLGGLLGGLFIGLHYKTSSIAPEVLTLGGAVAGAVGGGSVFPTVVACRDWLGPIASSTVLWGAVGFLTGAGAYYLSPWLPDEPVNKAESEEPATRSSARAAQMRQLLAFRLFLFFALLAFAFCTLLVIISTRF